MRKLILRNSLALGDVVMLTAAVRDLHECYPGEFLTDVRTTSPQLWENNPHIAPLSDDDPSVEVIDCHYPLIHHSNQRPYHFIHGFVNFLNSELKLNIVPTAFKGDIHLSETEKSWMSQVHEVFGDPRPFWIIVSGGKLDFTIKWWPVARYQAIVDAFKDRIQFVQVGAADHHHPALVGAYDLRGKTDVRQLLRLVYHSQGVLCGVTSLMHLAAAVETKDGSGIRPCVVIAGGREPSQWERYPGHRFLDTIGLLPCCATGGCWRSRSVPVGDGDSKDFPENLCVDVVSSHARCMQMISVETVIREIESYFSFRLSYRNSIRLELQPQVHPAEFARDSQCFKWDFLTMEFQLTENNSKEVISRVSDNIPEFPADRFSDDGVVICGGGSRLFPSTWVCVNLLRDQGCKLPIELWHLGPEELDSQMISLIEPLGVKCIDALKVRTTSPIRTLAGWELKAFSIVHSRFKRVMLLDADNMALSDVSRFFNWPEFISTGAVFWPDFGSLSPDRKVWEITGVEYNDEPEFESGQILIDKEKAWRPLLLTLWLNANSDFYFQYIHGDKDTFHLAFRRCFYAFAMPSRGINALDATMCQHDFDGNRIFQHRNLDKWRYECDNRNVADFWLDDRCRFHLRMLQRLWGGTIQKPTTRLGAISDVLRSYQFRLIDMVGNSDSCIAFKSNGKVIDGSEYRRWDFLEEADQLHLVLKRADGISIAFRPLSNGIWASTNPTGFSLEAVVNPHLVDDASQEIWQNIFVDDILKIDRLSCDTVIVDVTTDEGAFACACLRKGAKYVYVYHLNPNAFPHVGRNMENTWRIYGSGPDNGPFSCSLIDEAKHSLNSILCEFPMIHLLRISGDFANQISIGLDAVLGRVQTLYIETPLSGDFKDTTTAKLASNGFLLSKTVIVNRLTVREFSKRSL